MVPLLKQTFERCDWFTWTLVRECSLYSHRREMVCFRLYIHALCGCSQETFMCVVVVVVVCQELHQANQPTNLPAALKKCRCHKLYPRVWCVINANTYGPTCVCVCVYVRTYACVIFVALVSLPFWGTDTCNIALCRIISIVTSFGLSI